jgi:hypothetical protein
VAAAVLLQSRLEAGEVVALQRLAELAAPLQVQPEQWVLPQGEEAAELAAQHQPAEGAEEEEVRHRRGSPV